MNKLEVYGLDIYYTLGHVCHEYDGDLYWTDFYTKEGVKNVKKWSWKKFRMVSTGEVVPNFIERFTLPFWITKSSHLTKKELRTILEKKVSIINREKELERGEFI
jgi:hypothetical protein